MADVVYIVHDLNDGIALRAFLDLNRAEEFQDSVMELYPENEIVVVPIER